MKTSVKILLAIIAVLVVALGVIGGFFLGAWQKGTQTPTPTITATAKVTGTVMAETLPPAASPTVPGFQNFTGYVTADIGLNLRNKPTTSDTVILTIPYAADVLVDGEQGDFYHGSYQGTVGYFAKQYISKTNLLAAWKTYDSTPYAFSMKYPDNWTITKDDYVTDPMRWLQVEFGGKMMLGVDFPTGFEEATTLSENSISFDGVAGTKTLLQNPDGTKFYITSVQKGGSTYFIVATETGNVWRLIDLMVGTWKWK